LGLKVLRNTRTLDAGYFSGLLETRRDCRLDRSPEAWDGLAEKWIGDLGPDGLGKPGMNSRVDYTARYLRSRGLLGADSSVIDVGCGPGLFVMEFAKTAMYAMGLDHSPRFLEYAAVCANERGIRNVSFVEADFLALDVERAGFAGAFDLVFASITPAATGNRSLKKLMKMSRGFCYSVSFVNVRDTLAERVSLDVFGEEYKPRFDGTGFYALLNLLWLDGYYPETSYYTDSRMETVIPDVQRASDCATLCGRFEPGDAAKVLRYMEKHGALERCSDYRYGSILWDMRDKDARQTR
jgi:SAM-dependent methyltransferase